MATYSFQEIGEVSGDMDRVSCVKYPYLWYFIMSSFKCRTRSDGRDRMSKRWCNQGYYRIILLVDGQVRMTRNDVPWGCKRQCRSDRVIACRLQSIPELICVTIIRVDVLLAIGARVTLGRFGFPKSSRVGFLAVLLHIVELVDHIRVSIKSFKMWREVSGTRELKEMSANINISTRILWLNVVNDILYGRRKRHERMVCYDFIGLTVCKEMSIGWLVIRTLPALSGVYVLLFVRGDMISAYIGVTYFGREAWVN